MVTVQTVEPYEFDIQVAPGDIDDLNHVNNVTYVRWVETAATRHWQSAADPEDLSSLTWVIIRHEIDYLRAAQMGDIVRARTWVGKANRLRFHRHTELRRASDQTLLVRSLTIWCPVDPVSLRPTAPSERVRKRFSTQEEGL